ncbi:ADP-ribose pyrophosphatase [hydrothermal vent metagenome]|uniref:ADP-ribose pyrophosphatase n=1 Tax=hydrothermal vent metagenome TaxID=652676 RepID=A0A3B1AEP7_9ZZZZ
MPPKIITQDNITRIGIGAVVFRDDAVLLVKRRNPPNKGQWAIPGGKVRFLEPLKVAVAREILEETGIVIEVQEPIYTFEVISSNKEKTAMEALHYVVIDYRAEYLSGEVLAADDAQSAAWINREDYKNLDINQETRTLLHEKFNFP